jgi:hypothetical protein
MNPERHKARVLSDQSSKSAPSTHVSRSPFFRIRGFTLLAIALLMNSARLCFGQFQPMLLNPGTFSLNATSGIIQVAAKCLDESLHTPELGHTFTDYTDGITVTRTIGQQHETVPLSKAVELGWLQPEGLGNYTSVGFKPNSDELNKGANFEVTVDRNAPQYVATGQDQVAKVNQLVANHKQIFQHVDAIVDRFIDEELPQWKSFFGDTMIAADSDDLRDSLKQTLLWELADSDAEMPDDAIRLLEKRLAQGLETQTGIPLTDNAPDVADRLEILLKRSLSPRDYEFLNKIRGYPLAQSNALYQDCALVESAGDAYNVYYQGATQNFDYLSDLSNFLHSSPHPPAHIIFVNYDSAASPLDDKEAISLSNAGFAYVIDRDFFAQHGVPKKPKRIIVIASDDAENGPALNKLIFGGQTIKLSWLKELQEGLGDNVQFVTTQEELEDALSDSKPGDAVPWVIGHNENGEFLLGDGTSVDIDDLAPRAVSFSCSLYTSKDKSMAVRTTADLDVRTLFNALSTSYNSTDDNDLLKAVWANYYSDKHYAEQVRNTALWAVGSGSIVYIAYEANQGGGSRHTSKTRHGVRKSHSATLKLEKRNS